jgi:parvulin-like peptidyl-prolyl isomerase
MIKKNPYLLNLLILLTLIALAACGDNGLEGEEIAPPDASSTELDSPSIAPTPSVTITPTSSPLPTPTPQLAALVNGQPILLEAYEQELARYELAQVEQEIGPDEKGNDYRELVLDALIERELIRQAAVVQGVTISPDSVDLKMNELRETANEQGNFDDWLMANLWTEEDFRKALEAELIVEMMAAAITIDVPSAMEQVHVRYIQVDNSDLAQSLLGQLREDGDFADLAQRYSLDQATAPYGGDLGFFARGSLLVPEVETTAFNLQPGEVSDVISVTDPDSGLITYYIVKLIERDPSRMLGADLRYRLLQEAFESWLEEQKMGATITKFLENQG